MYKQALSKNKQKKTEKYISFPEQKCIAEILI